eukprot:scaffold1235_cov300-Pavlova_lutheri.AAC.12
MERNEATITMLMQTSALLHSDDKCCKGERLDERTDSFDKSFDREPLSSSSAQDLRIEEEHLALKQLKKASSRDRIRHGLCEPQ